MPMTLFFAVCHFSSPDIVFLELPRMPPKGYITSILVNLMITEIFGIVTLQTCSCMWKQICVTEIKALIQWQTDRPIEAGLNITLNFCSGDGCYHDGYPWNKGLCDVIHSIVFTIHDCLSFKRWWYISLVDFLTKKNFSYLNLNARSLCTKIYTRISLVRVKFLREITTSLHNFSVGRVISTLGKLIAVAYSTSTDSDDFDQLASFDTDSSFWVCDNSATRHIGTLGNRA
jgi:hypothetical protein